MTAAPYSIQSAPFVEVSGLHDRPDSARRFTRDGSGALENHLDRVCEAVQAGVQNIIPPHKLEALVLGGGYGRGEGGVLKTKNGDQPYNDLEFYAFLRGNRFWNERKYNSALHEWGRQLSPEAGLDVEFKVDSLAHFRRSPVTMFSYDLVSGHRVLTGDDSVIRGCAQHFDAGRIPMAEATRLLMNRCSGLFFSLEKLSNEVFTAGDADFVGRNIAKAQLGFGDAVLTAVGQYHWSCLERSKRLRGLSLSEFPAWLDEVRQHHAAGVEFKLNPFRMEATAGLLRSRFEEIRALALKVWLWLEDRRLGRSFKSAQDYVLSAINKSPGTNPCRNFLLNMRVFGLLNCFCTTCFRHPRENILNSLALLLWEPHSAQSCLQHQLTGNELDVDGNTKKCIQAFRVYWSRLS